MSMLRIDDNGCGEVDLVWLVRGRAMVAMFTCNNTDVDVTDRARTSKMSNARRLFKRNIKET